MLEQLKKEYEGKNFKLVDFDNSVLENLMLIESDGMFGKNLMEILYDGNYVYVTNGSANTGFQFFFEIVENDETYPRNIVIKVTKVAEF